MDQQSRVAVLIGENELLLEGLKHILAEAKFRVVATAPSIAGVVISHLASDQLILLIVNVGGDQNAMITQVKRFKEQRPTSIVFLFADHDKLSVNNIIAAFDCGANVYCVKPSCDILIKSLELVMTGETILSPAAFAFILRQKASVVAREVETSPANPISPIAHAKASSAYCPRLSEREQAILRCLIEGYSNKIIARKNDIAEATVKVHVKAILRKIRVNNRTQAAIWGMSHDAFIGGAGNGDSSVSSAGPQRASSAILAPRL